MKLTKQMKAFFQEIGAEGGKAAASKMTPEQRKERARNAGKAKGKARSKKPS